MRPPEAEETERGRHREPERVVGVQIAGEDRLQEGPYTRIVPELRGGEEEELWARDEDHRVRETLELEDQEEGYQAARSARY